MVRLFKAVFPSRRVSVLTGSRYGIAFDDGAPNRVVEEGRDSEELQKLELFLASETASLDTANADDGPPHRALEHGSKRKPALCLTR